VFVLSAVAAPALAQSFPADDAWVAFPCGPGLMTDPRRDQSGAIDERDVVGDDNAPAGFRAVDSQFFYLRLRVDSNPLQGANLRPFAWGFAFSSDALGTTYELLITADGATGQVGVYRNTIATVPDSPADPADQPPMTFPFATHGRVRAAASSFGGNGDSFIDMAVPWSALSPLGLLPATPIIVWAGSSSSADRLNGDLACHDALSSTTVPPLSGTGSGSTTPGATTPPPPGASGPSLEGGPGCTTLPASSGGAPLAFLLLAFLVSRRRR
jgi:hypothetical protein